MARHPRLALPGVPLHVIQRGNNRAQCFFEDGDYELYLDCLRRASLRFGCKVHAYVLMTNHVHLLVTPCEVHAVSRLMQWIGRRYVRTFNERHERSGTLWEGRFRSSLVDSEHYFLACQRYIELNPVRAGMVRQARDYPWSSHRYYLDDRPDPLLVAHETYLALGVTSSERRAAYQALCECDADPGELQSIRSSANKGRPLGSREFRVRVETASGQRARPESRSPREGPTSETMPVNLLW